MVEDHRLAELAARVKNIYAKSKSHDWSHVKRVLEYSRELNKIEKGNQTILFPAVLLHDLNRCFKKHSEKKILFTARQILLKTGYSNNEIAKILSCVKTHSTFSNRVPQNVEDKILFDSDKIDSFGAIGVSRFFTLAGEKKWNLDQALRQAVKRITRLSRVSGFYTQSGKKLGFKKAVLSFAFYYVLARELEKSDVVKKLERLALTKLGIRGKAILSILNFLTR